MLVLTGRQKGAEWGQNEVRNIEDDQVAHSVDVRLGLMLVLTGRQK